MKWNAINLEADLPKKTGEYLVTLKRVDEEGEHRCAIVAKFTKTRYGHRWTYHDGGGENTMNNTNINTWTDWEDETLVCSEQIIAWAEMPAPFEG